MSDQKIYAIAAFSLICSSIHPTSFPPISQLEHPQIPDSAIAQLPSFGTLCEDENGFVYIDLDDRYIHELIHFIETVGFEEPPYFGEPGLVGAHISVIYANEPRKGEIEECGKVISFTPLQCKIVHPLNWDGIEKVFLIEVDAPELDLIREKYGLPKNQFGFHITIGVKFQEEFSCLDKASKAALCSASFFEAPMPIPASLSSR